MGAPTSSSVTAASSRQPQASLRYLRRCGYWVVALALLPLLLAQFSGVACLSVGYLLASPLLHEQLQPMSPFQRKLWALLEALLVFAILSKLALPWPVSVPILLTLVLCQLAEGGYRRCLLGLSSLGLGALGLALARRALGLDVFVALPAWPSGLNWSSALSFALLLFMAVAFTHIGHQRSLRLYRAKRLLGQQSEQLQRMNSRLARYLPAELPARVAGAPEQRLRLQRTWLTVVFVDLCDFGACTRALEAEALAVILNDYLTMLDEHCRRAEGSLSKVVGDGALLVFEPGATETQALAARRAIALCESLPAGLTALHDAWRRQGLVTELQVRAGVASGHCSIGDWGQARLDYTVIGDRVNLAARLQAQATPGRVLLDDATALLVAEQVALDLAEPLTLKGMGTVTPYVLGLGGLVDQVQRSAMVPSVSVALEASAASSQAVSGSEDERQQTVLAGLQR